MRALEQLLSMKGQFGAGGKLGNDAAQRTEQLLKQVSKSRLREAADLIRLHETVLFLRAYPQSEAVVKLADDILFSFQNRIAHSGHEAFEDVEISGISGTSVATAYSHQFASSLILRHAKEISIDWDAFDRPDRLGPVLGKLLPAAFEDWSVEPHVDWRTWFEKAGCTLAWLLQNIEPSVYDSLEIPLRWNLAPTNATRSRTRITRRRIYYHTGAFLKRSDVSFEHEFQKPPMPIERVANPHKLLAAIVDTSAVRYRELWGFMHADVAHVYHADFDRGVDFYFFGVPREWRLPFRAYHCGMFFKNGVPLGYFEGLSFFERMEVGFNLYYTFREGETAWLYAQTLKLFREQLGVTCFTIDPYQLGHENEEAIESGAYWFYRKLGFQPVTEEIASLSKREEDRIKSEPGYRTPPAKLRRLAQMPVVYGPSLEWGRFSLHRLAQKVQKANGKSAWESLLKNARAEVSLKEIQEAKNASEEFAYLHLLQRSPKLRSSVLRLGSPATGRGDFVRYRRAPNLADEVPALTGRGCPSQPSWQFPLRSSGT